jgi:hypothetical protein
MPATYTLRPKADKDVDAISNTLAELASLEVALHFPKTPTIPSPCLPADEVFRRILEEPKL